jgi:hypothetical protein
MLMQLVTHLMKKKVSTEKAPLFIVWNRNSFATTLRYSMLSVITCFVVSIVRLSVRHFGTNVNETICVLLQTWQITHRDMKFAVCLYQCLWQPQLLNYNGCVALQCVWMWFQSLFLITWANFVYYLKYYSFLNVLSTIYFDTDQEINLILGNEWILWQVSILNGSCDRRQY